MFIHNNNTLHTIRTLVCQVKATLNQLKPKLKTLDQKEESQEDQQEQESSIHNNDQKSPEKGQKPKTRKPSRPQFVISFPEGETTCPMTHQRKPNWIIANELLHGLQKGEDRLLPNTWTLQVIHREDLE